jgi:hypothetical protein
MLTPLRKDENQWLIYQEDSVRPITDGVKSLLMHFGAMMLMRHEDIAVRAVGHYGASLSDTHLDQWSQEDATEEQQAVAQHLADIYAWLAEEGERPDQALDEFHAAVVWSDKRARAAGVKGPGWYREIVREP